MWQDNIRFGRLRRCALRPAITGISSPPSLRPRKTTLLQRCPSRSVSAWCPILNLVPCRSRPPRIGSARRMLCGCQTRARRLLAGTGKPKPVSRSPITTRSTRSRSKAKTACNRTPRESSGAASAVARDAPHRHAVGSSAGIDCRSANDLIVGVYPMAPSDHLAKSARMLASSPSCCGALLLRVCWFRWRWPLSFLLSPVCGSAALAPHPAVVATACRLHGARRRNVDGVVQCPTWPRMPEYGPI
jgi:hypothetical protein